MTQTTPGATLTEPPIDGNEVDTLVGSLERQRRTFAWKCSGLTQEQMQARIAASDMTLGGLVKHVALVEASWFTWRLAGRDPGRPWNEIDWDEDPNWEWRTAADDSPDELMQLWRYEVGKARVAIAEAIDASGLETRAKWTSPEGDTPTARRILIDMVEEYARHVGHADLIRESIDGLVGEDPPPEFTSELSPDMNTKESHG